MTNKEIYKIMDRLGMVEEKDGLCACELFDGKTDADYFAEDTCKDVVDLTNFVSQIVTFNDLHTIEKFLVCLFHENYEHYKKVFEVVTAEIPNHKYSKDGEKEND